MSFPQIIGPYILVVGVLALGYWGTLRMIHGVTKRLVTLPPYQTLGTPVASTVQVCRPPTLTAQYVAHNGILPENGPLLTTSNFHYQNAHANRHR